MAKPGGFLLEKARERRRAFWERRGWLIPLLAAVPVLAAWLFSSFYSERLARWATRGELNAFWIGVAVVGAAWVFSYLLGLDGGGNLRQAAEAEQWTARALRPLRRQGWVAFHDIQLGGWNIDHALVGPQGAVAVETKWTGDELRVDASGIRRTQLSGKPRREWSQLREARRHAQDLHNLLQQGNVHAEVLPLMVLWGPQVTPIDGGARWVNGVLVAAGRQAAQWLPQVRNSPLAEPALARAVEALRQHERTHPSAPRTEAAPRAGSAPAGSTPPPRPGPLACEVPPVLQRRPSRPSPPPPLTPEDRALFEALRRWRREVARQEGIPAFQVLHDSHLRDLTQRRPATAEELSACAGIGPTKLGKYGEAILRLVNEPMIPAGSPAG